jgi:GDP-mannose 6-dehydrogenase
LKISVFGVGYVGAVSAGCLVSLGFDVVAVDISPDKIAMLNRGISPIVEAEIDTLIAGAVASGKLHATSDVHAAVLDTDISFISVGTPSAPDGSVSMRAVDEVVKSIGHAIAQKATPHTVVMRSTVPPGTAEDRVIPALEQASGKTLGHGFHYYSNPEFLREGTSVRDFHAPPFTLIGAPPGDDGAPLRTIYAAVDAPVHVAPYRIAESVKYLSNAYHAVKLAFANEAGGVLAAYGVDAREAFRLFCEDRSLNISPAYLRPGFAFGGSCLPKDMRSLLALADRKDIPAPFLGNVMPSNDAIIARVFDLVSAHPRGRVALFGLAFKPGTDDMRESPFVVLAERLLGRGYDLRIFDRYVQTARLVGSNRAFIEKEIPHLDRLLVGTVEEALADAPLILLGHIGAADRKTLLAGLTTQSVIDLAGVPDVQSHPGIAYQGLCW